MGDVLCWVCTKHNVLHYGQKVPSWFCQITKLFATWLQNLRRGFLHTSNGTQGGLFTFANFVAKVMFCANLRPKEHHPNCEAWWWQHHVMGMFLINRDLGTCQERRENGWNKIQKNPRGNPAALCKKAETRTEVHLLA